MIIEIDLFGYDKNWTATSTMCQGTNPHSHYYRKKHLNNLDIAVTALTSGDYDMPTLKAYDGSIPNTLIPFNQAASSNFHCCGVHFFIDDYMFNRIWTEPKKYVPMLRRFQCVIGPDFSQYRNMPYPARLYNCYRNRLLSQYFQDNGIKLVPNVTWSLPDSYDYSFTGIPKNSVIAINSTGIIGCTLSKFLWYKGYKEAIERLSPSLIIRYGSKLAHENESISRYYQNERLMALKNGRKW